jgi:carnitine O-acetyltransferase
MAIRTFTQPSNSLNNNLNKHVTLSLSSNSNMAQKGGPNSSEATGNLKPKAGTTFAHQDELPSLPIPDLESTVRKYLDSLRPLQTEKEHHETKIAAREFLKYQGPELQNKLKKYAEGKSNYIEQFCT